MSPCNKVTSTHKSISEISKTRYYSKKQFNQSSVNNVSCKNKFVVSGLYPAEIRDSLVCNDNSNECEENISIENDTDFIVNAKINGCVGEVLFDSGAEISLMDERFLERHKKHLKKIPILPVNHKIIKSATGESQTVSYTHLDVYKRQVMLYVTM